MFYTVCTGGAFGVLGTLAKLGKATVSFVMPVHLSAWNDSVSTGRIFIKFVFEYFSKKISRKFKSRRNGTRIAGTVHEQYTFLIISCLIPRRMRNFRIQVLDKMKKHILYSIFFFLGKSCRL